MSKQDVNICGTCLLIKDHCVCLSPKYLGDTLVATLNSIEQTETPPEIPRPEIWPLVIEDMKSRDQFGRAKYGTPLTGMSKFDGLLNAYEEALDLVCYLRKALYDRDHSRPAQ